VDFSPRVCRSTPLTCWYCVSRTSLWCHQSRDVLQVDTITWLWCHGSVTLDTWSHSLVWPLICQLGQPGRKLKTVLTKKRRLLQGCLAAVAAVLHRRLPPAKWWESLTCCFSGTAEYQKKKCKTISQWHCRTMLNNFEIALYCTVKQYLYWAVINQWVSQTCCPSSWNGRIFSALMIARSDLIKYSNRMVLNHTYSYWNSWIIQV